METQVTTDEYGWEVIAKSGGLLDQFITIGIKKKGFEGYHGAYTRIPDILHSRVGKGRFVVKVAEALKWFTGGLHENVVGEGVPWKKVRDKLDELYNKRRKMDTTNTNMNWTVDSWTTVTPWIGIDYSSEWVKPYVTPGPPVQLDPNQWVQWVPKETTNQEEEEMSSEQFVIAEFVAVNTQKLEEIVRGSVIAKDSALARTKFIVENKIDVDLVGEGIITVINLGGNTFTRYTETVKLEIEV